jgi:multiple sugar transport system substrate-binding protein
MAAAYVRERDYDAREFAVITTGRTARGALLITAVLLLGACGGSSGTATQAANEPVTITFWHGFNLPNDLAALDANLKDFQTANPNITVAAVPNVTDDKLTQGLRNPNGPDVVSSFTTDNVGMLCSGPLQDLNPLLAADGIDKGTTFVGSMIKYTQFNGKQCTLPWEGDAYGLYYNTDQFAAAGITSPPKTTSEFLADAVKLTKSNGASYDQLGFMPNFHTYEGRPTILMTQWGPAYLDAQGKSNLATDPQVEKYLQYMKSLSDALGGYAKLEAYRGTLGEEWSAQNAFEVGKVAMQIDGEWRINNLKLDNSTVHWAVAPLPVPDDKIAQYGMGATTGTVIGISSTTKHQAAAWALVKFLTTDTTAVVRFANQVVNLPSTIAAATSPDLKAGGDYFSSFQKMIDISHNQYSASTPTTSNGGAYQTILTDFAYKWEAGQVPDLHAGLVQLDQEIDAANQQ